jgi:hypothetical protein
MAEIFEFSPNISNENDEEVSVTDVDVETLRDMLENSNASVPTIKVADYIRQLMVFDRGNDRDFQDWLNANECKFSDTDIAELKGWNAGIRFAINQAKEMLLGIVDIDDGGVSFDE